MPVNKWDGPPIRLPLVWRTGAYSDHKFSVGFSPEFPSL
jgi:hypothetical protein